MSLENETSWLSVFLWLEGPHYLNAKEKFINLNYCLASLSGIVSYSRELIYVLTGQW